MRLNELTIEILQKCPNNCIFCSSNSSPNSKYKIDLESFKKVVDESIKLGVNYIYLSGGEPFLHEDLLEMVKYIKKNDIHLYIYTSGLIYNKNNEICSLDKDLIKKLKDEKVEKIVFDVQTTSEENYNKLMGTENRLNFVKESIKKVRDEDIFTEIHFVPNLLNYNDLEDLLLFAKEYHINKVSLLRFVPQGRGYINNKILQINDEQLMEFKKYIINLKNKYEKFVDIRIGIPLSNKENEHKCNAGCGKLVIRYDGKVYPCEAYKELDYITNPLAKEDEYDFYGDCVMYNLKDIAYPESAYEKSLTEIYENSNFLIFIRNYGELFKNKFNDFSC